MEGREGLVKSLEEAWQEPVSAVKNNGRNAGGTIRFLGYDNDGCAINQVDVWLKQDELSIFIQALVDYPWSLPTDYLQTVEPIEDGFCVRIRSHEPPKIFVSRLSSAMSCLKQSA